MSRNKSCFIISPIGQAGSMIRHHADDVYQFIIKPAMQKFGIDPKRSDEVSESGRITDQMFDRIFRADLCVVILTGFNPNVFYELAVAQCAARPTLLLVEKGQELPFDIKDLRTIEYELQPISRLVNGYYARILEGQLSDLEARKWKVPGLFEQFDFAPKLQTEQEVRKVLDRTRPKPLSPGVDGRFSLPFDSKRFVTIVTGDIFRLIDGGVLAELGVDVVVSLENTYLQIDNYFATSISGKLRCVDAGKSAGGRLQVDHLRKELDDEIQARNIVLPVAPGTVIPTRTHELAKKGIKAVFHVAGTSGMIGDGYKLPNAAIDDCIRGVFHTFTEQAETMRLKTLLLPILGSFMSNLEQEEVVRRILGSVLLKLQHMPACHQVFLLAWTESQRAALRQVAKELELKEIGAASETGGAGAAERAGGAQ